MHGFDVCLHICNDEPVQLRNWSFRIGVRNSICKLAAKGKVGSLSISGMSVNKSRNGLRRSVPLGEFPF